MASEKILNQKMALVAALKEKITNSPAGVIVDYKGISVAEDTALRKELREAGVDYFVVKNTMLHLAVQGTNYTDFDSALSGSTALAIASEEDNLAAARILVKYSEKSKGKFSVKTGYMDSKVIDAATVEQLAKLPGREALLAMFLSAVTGNLRGLAVAVNAIAEKTSGEASE